MTAVVQALTPEEVDAGLDEIRGWLGEYPEATVIRLYEGRAWLAKGYPDWDALMAAEIPSRVQLPRPERREVVGRLRAEGLSTRAIASAVGVDHSTVVRDITATGADAPVERPDTVTGLDGKTRKAHVTTTTRTTEATKVEHDIDVATGEILPGPGLPDPVEESRPITSEQWKAENPDPLAEALAEFPELDIPGAPAEYIVITADALRGMPERQRPARLENARKWLTAKAEGRLDPKPEPPDLWPPVFKAITATLRAIREAGGVSALRDELPHLIDVEASNNLAQAADLAHQLSELAAATPKLRRIK